MQTSQQKFSIGYHLNSWDLAGLAIEPALAFLSGQGFRWFEILFGNTLGGFYEHKYMQLGATPPPRTLSDTDLLRRLAILSRGQDEHGIRLSSLYMNCELINPGTWPAERDALETVARLLAGFGAPILVIGGGPSETAERPRSTDDYRAFAAALASIGARTQQHGIETVYHPHLDTFVENRGQLDRLMDVLDTSLVGLCIDPAHLVHTGSDPVDALRTYIAAVRYMHFKDSRVSPELRAFDRYKAFCELGAGVVDLPALVKVLLDHDYDGLAIIELDAFGTTKTMEQSALESISYVTNVLGLSLNP